MDPGPPSVMLGLLVAAMLAWPATSLAVGFTAPIDHAVGDSPVAVAAADFNGDGDPDLAVANNASYDVSVLLGAAGAGFGPSTEYATGATFPKAIAIGNFNADAFPDLVSAVTDQDSASVLLGGTGGTFGTASLFSVGPPNGPGGGPDGVAVADFDADADPDLALSSGDRVSVLLGSTGGSFGPVTPYYMGSRWSIVAGEFNGDTDPDLATVNTGAGDVSILTGATGGTFDPPANYEVGDFPPDSTPKLAVGDFNGDTDPDLALTRHGDVFVLLGGLGASFGSATQLDAGDGPGSVAVGDLNGDGDLDLVVANGYSNDVSVLLGGAGASFSAQARFAAEGPTGVAIADVNVDGDPDIVITRGGADTVSVLLNTEHAPATPTFTSSDPPSPANNNAPKIRGSAPAGTTVRLYATNDCAGAPAAMGSAADFAASGLTVSVPDESSTTFRATATNTVDVPSACSSASLTYIEHSNPPTAAISAGPNPALTGAPVTFDASASTGFGIVRYEWDLDGDGVFEIDSGPTPTTTQSFAAPAELNPGVRVTNDLGNTIARTPLSVRLAPPPGALGVSINSGAQFTNEKVVTVLAVWPPLTRTMLVSNDGGFANPGKFPIAAERSWTLDSSGPERLPKTIYVRFDDSSQTFTDDIILDETDPTIASATATPVSDGAARAAAVRKRSFVVRIVARDRTSGVRGIQITSNKRKPGRLRTYKRSARLRKAVRFRTSSARIYVRVRDAAGNNSRWRRARRR